jgi:hypothetical protein
MKLDGTSEASLTHSLSALPPEERGWITFAEARVLFSTKDAQYAFGETDDDGRRKTSSASGCPRCAKSGPCWRAVIAAKPPHNLRKLLSRNRNWAVTESLQLNGSSIARRVSHELEMAAAAKFFDLVKSPSVVVVSVTARERSEHRSLVLATPLSSRTAD